VDGFLHFVLSDCLSEIPDSLADLGKLQRKRMERLRCCAYSTRSLSKMRFLKLGNVMLG
jgi:hypothetical protein